MFESATVFGLGALAVWAYVRFPKMRPQSLVRAASQVAIPFIALSLLPELLGLLLPVARERHRSYYAPEGRWRSLLSNPKAAARPTTATPIAAGICHQARPAVQ